MAKYIEMESCRARRQTIDNGRRARGERRPSGRRGARRPDPRPLTRRPRARRVDREGGRARHDRHRNPRRFGNPMYLTRDMVKATSGKLCNLGYSCLVHKMWIPRKLRIFFVCCFTKFRRGFILFNCTVCTLGEKIIEMAWSC